MTHHPNWYSREKTARAGLAAAALTGALAFTSPGAAGGGFTPSDAFKATLARHEGYMPSPYRDSEGILTVGIGFNLERPNAAALLKRHGIELSDVLQGRRKVTKEEAWSLAESDLKTAISDARALFTNFDSAPVGVQEVLVNMSFNLGKSRLAGFKKLREAVAAGDWNAASREMLDSKWAAQVGKGDHKDGQPQRAKELAQQMRRGGAAADPKTPAASAGGRVPSPPPSPSSGAAAGGGKVVTVVPGDTLSGLAKKHLGDGSRWQEIAALNGIKDPSGIRPGQKLRLP